MSTAKQWLGKHVPTTTEKLLEAVISMWSVLRLYSKDQENQVSQKYERLKLGGGQAYGRSSD
jgi:hypothetical protein